MCIILSLYVLFQVTPRFNFYADGARDKQERNWGESLKYSAYRIVSLCKCSSDFVRKNTQNAIFFPTEYVLFILCYPE